VGEWLDGVVGQKLPGMSSPLAWAQFAHILAPLLHEMLTE
jgi:hypothetical protein